MKKYSITLVGYEKLQVELSALKTEESHATPERQEFIKDRIKVLEDKISHANIVDPKKLSGDTIIFAATVTLVDGDDNEITYQIVDMEEAASSKGCLSDTSPLARALIGKTAGEYAEVGAETFEVIKVAFV